MFKFLKKVIFYIFLSHLLYLVALKWVNPPINITQINSIIEGYGFTRDNIGYDEMPENIKLAVIASEDQLFASHSGFDRKMIERAMEFNENQNGKIRGASTISQQTAKNVFLWQGRSWIRKGLEAYFTFMIELIWGKQRILEVYLNNAEMGKGIFGIEAAAQYYFNKPASQLTRNEAARIAVVLPSPKRYAVNPPGGYVSKRANWVERQMRNLKGDPELEKILAGKTN